MHSSEHGQIVDTARAYHLDPAAEPSAQSAVAKSLKWPRSALGHCEGSCLPRQPNALSYFVMKREGEPSRMLGLFVV